MSPNMSQPVITHNTNRPNAADTGSVKSTLPAEAPNLVPARLPISPLLSAGLSPVGGPDLDWDGDSDDAFHTHAGRPSHVDADSTPPQPAPVAAESLSPPPISLGPSEKFPEIDPNQGPFHKTDCRKLEIPFRPHEPNATTDASEPGIPLGLRTRGLYMSPASKVPPGGPGAGLIHPPLARHRPAGQRAGPSGRRLQRAPSLAPLHLRSAAGERIESTRDFDSLSLAPFNPAAENLPPDENVPISPGPNAVESPPGLSHTFNYWASPDANIPRAHTHGFGPNGPGLTSPLPPRFFQGENEYVRSLADERYLEEEERERTSRGNDVATQDARRAGVQQRDFAPVVERPWNSRGPGYSNADEYRDREEMNLVCGPEAMLMEEQQRLRFAEDWEDAGLWRLWELWFNP
jgi:hypothetical protein